MSNLRPLVYYVSVRGDKQELHNRCCFWLAKVATKSKQFSTIFTFKLILLTIYGNSIIHYQTQINYFIIKFITIVQWLMVTSICISIVHCIQYKYQPHFCTHSFIDFCLPLCLLRQRINGIAIFLVSPPICRRNGFIQINALIIHK